MAPELVVVQGLRDTRGTLAALERAPAGRARARGSRGAAARRAALLLATLRRRARSRRRTRPASCCPASTSAPTLGAVGGVLFRNGARARAARDGVRGRLHRRQLAAAGGRALQGLVARGPRQGRRRWRSSSSSPRRSSRSRRRPTCWATAPRRSPRRRASRAAALILGDPAARDPGADRPVPAAGRVDDRQPPAARGTSCWPRRSRRSPSRSRSSSLAAFVEVYVSPHVILALR